VSSPKPLPERAGDTTAEDPWPVRLLSVKIADYVDKMSIQPRRSIHAEQLATLVWR